MPSIAPPASRLEGELETASGREEPLRQASAAAWVVTAEDLRRSGVTSLAEALRLVPGMHVSKIGSSVWAISARGFAEQYSGKLMVAIDGRPVYSNDVSGVYWDVQDLPLEDVERIEVIRGPAALQWGAGAMNGVVNVITRSAADTKGTLVSGTVGTEERAGGTLRYGANLEDGGAYRVWAKGSYRDSVEQIGILGGIEDDWWTARAGFRIDRDPSPDEHLTVHGGTYYGRSRIPSVLAGTVVDVPSVTGQNTDLSGSNLVARWSHDLGGGSEVSLRMFYDGSVRSSIAFDEGRDVLDAELRYRFLLAEEELSWGLGYRVTSSLFENRSGILFDPAERTDNLFSAFVQDQVWLASDELRLTVGTRLEHNDYSAFEIQPAAGLTWILDPDQVLWTSVSRAVRTPGQVDEDLVVDEAYATVMGQPTRVRLTGNSELEPEELWALDAGWRLQASETVAIDVAAFYYDYDSLRTREQKSFAADPANPGDFLQVLQFDNRAGATTWGVELATQWTPRDDWELVAGYSFLDLDYELDASSNDTTTPSPEDGGPAHQVHIRSYHDLDDDLELDAGAWWVDELGSTVSSYFRLDTRLGWRPRRDLEMSLGVQGLFHDGQVEARPGFLSGVGEYESGVYLSLTWTPRDEGTPGELLAKRLP